MSADQINYCQKLGGAGQSVSKFWTDQAERVKWGRFDPFDSSIRKYTKIRPTFHIIIDFKFLFLLKDIY